MFTFDQALVELKSGKLLTRKGWNSAGQFIFLIAEDLPPELEPVFAMFTTKQTLQLGWTPTQADLLASDWGAPINGELDWLSAKQALQAALVHTANSL